MQEERARIDVLWRKLLEIGADAVEEIRQGVGSDEVPIHVIGGLARDATGAETLAFARAVRDTGAIGASYYTLPFVTDEQWGILGRR